jgi:diacylglycerol kinase family enzyme
VRAVAEARRGGVGGYLRWIRPIAATFVRYVPPALEIVVDGRAPARGGGVVVQNSFCYGGLFTLDRGARMDDGRLEVTVLRQANRRNYFLMLLRAFTGRLDRDHGVTMLSGTHVEVRSAGGAAVQLDGDPAGRTPVCAHPARRSHPGPPARGLTARAERYPLAASRIATTVWIRSPTVSRNSMFGPSDGAWSSPRGPR